MDSFRQVIFRFIKDWSLVAPGDRVLVACSGGVDSVALLHFMASNRKKMGIEVAAIHVDHKLRGKESAIDGTFVETMCEMHGLPFFGGSVPVPDIIEKDGGNVQAVCRDGRYAFFTDIMQEHSYSVLATAHHAEDQLETVLMQMTKGRMPSGIPVKREIDGGLLIRPFLPVMKAELYSYVAENDLHYREDPSNGSDTYLRNRFRHRVLPFVLNENPAAAENAVRMTGLLQQDEELLETLAQDRLDEIMTFTEAGLPTVDGNAFSDMHQALQRRMITLLLKYIYDGENVPVKYNSALINQLLYHLASQNGNVSIHLPRGYRFVREYDVLTFVRDTPNEEMTGQKILPKGTWTSWGNDLQIYWNEADNPAEELLTDSDEIMYFDLPHSAFPLSIRRREDGDRILLPGMENPKRLSRLFIDEKVAMTERDRLPILVTAQGEVCAVPGVRYGVPFSGNRTDRSKYIVSTRRLSLIY
ncbi:tRNA lysidine(34) synthetase TilS [Sporosarcina sp. JAI121]|uniref:tRNA lysidine(34) synthetase TilS n=1 Tax=Sporosarcina sp. JAI121 TaxID=2723064 RepID=UPI0015C9BEB8|nr:tRNA lysidine(34) synthetase TilS [Sporosarcina sp. JAI121]NYF26430.1 tRNA(Ile)-lysidine synthase/bifunctional protein TilS/HprT [Sporosarcina sp. JAI121]